MTSIVMLILNTASFVHWKVSIFSFPYVILWKPVIKSSPHSAGGTLLYHLERMYLPWEEKNYLEFFSKADLSLLPHLFIFTIIYLYQYWLRYHFTFGVTVKYCQHVLLLIIFQLWPLGALLGWFLHSFCMPYYYYFFLFSNSLLSGALGSSRLILYFLPQTKNQGDFSREPSGQF